LLGIFPYAGIDLMANSMLRDAMTARYEARGDGTEPGVVHLLACGAANSQRSPRHPIIHSPRCKPSFLEVTDILRRGEHCVSVPLVIHHVVNPRL